MLYFYLLSSIVLYCLFIRFRTLNITLNILIFFSFLFCNFFSLSTFSCFFYCIFNLEFAEILCYDFGIELKKIWFVTDCKEKVKFCLTDRYNDVNVVLKEMGTFLKEDMEMKFDVVIGNPPYQKANDDSSFTNLWADFVHKSFSISARYVIMITPKTWGNQVTKENNSSKVFNLIKKYARDVNIDECSKYFPNIGSSFSYYLLDKQNQHKKCSIVTTSDKFETKLSDITFIPKDFNLTTMNILRKMLDREMFSYLSSSGTIGNISNVKTKHQIYSVRYSMGTEKWSDKPHAYQLKPKLIFPNQTTQNYPIYAPTSAPANRGVFYLVKNKMEALKILSYIKSKPIQFLIAQQRTHHGVLNTQVIKHIPKIDISKNWNDKKLYQYFKLTNKEIDYIEAITGDSHVQ